MTNRASWSRWEVGDPFLQQVPGKPDGVTEARCMVTCPHCKESINVAAANARKNLSLTARQHQKKCECLSTVRHEALPASKRPRTEAAGDHPSAMNALQRELAEKDRRLRMYAEGETRLVTRNDTLASQVHLLEEQMSRQAEKVDQLQQQVSSILPVIQGIHRALRLSAPPVLPVEQYVDRIKGLRKAAALASKVDQGRGSEDRLRRERDRYRAQSDSLAHALEHERSKGHDAHAPDTARQRRRLLKVLHPDNAPKYAHCSPAQILETLSKRLSA